MKKLKILLTSAITCLALVTNAKADQKYRVGVLLPMSGDTAFIGEACRNGFELARSGLKPDLKSRMEFIYEDDQMNPKSSVSGFNRLTSGNGVDAVVNFSSGTSKALGPLADAKKIPLIAVASDKGVVDGRSHVVSFWVTPEEQVKLLLQEIHNRGYKRIVRITAMHNATEAYRVEFDRVNDGKVEVVQEDDYLIEAKDFKPFLIKLKSKKSIDAIFVNLFFGQVGIFAKQAKELGINLPLFGIETFEDKNEVKNSGGALIGQWYIQADDGPNNFLGNYKKRFPNASTYTAVNCHDIALLLAHGADKKLSTDAMMKFLKNVNDFPGAGGKFSATGDNRFTLPAVVKVVTKDGFEELNG